MTEILIFYSWQSDLPNKVNRSFIHDVLKRACSSLEKEIPNLSIKIDQDTRDTTGSRDISEVLLAKIGHSDIFVGDISIINSGAEKDRRCPNPNVMFEYGFAMRHLGEDNVITIFNEAYGAFPDDLPFDLKSRTHTRYKLNDDNVSDKKQVRIELLKRVLADLRSTIANILQARLLPGLDDEAHKAFSLACETALTGNDTNVNAGPIQENLGLDDDGMVGVLDLLENNGYIKTRPSLNHNLLPFLITDMGLLMYAQLTIDGLNAIPNRLIELIVREKINNSTDLAERIELPSILIEAMLNDLENQGLITLARIMNTSLISSVAPRTIREIRATTPDS